MTAAAMLSCESRRWGDRDDDDGEEEVVEVDDNDETTTTSASPPPATTDPSPPWRIHPPHPSPARLVIPVFRNLFFGPKKAFLTSFLRIFFLRFPEEFFT